ncbi:hypothetical protein KA005_09455 [bacterium]|nr:hypothetical protein [bacterium]
MSIILWKIIIVGIILLETVIGAFLGWRVLDLMKRVKQVQDDRNELIEERAKQSNKLRLKGIEIDEENKKKFILSELEKKMILNALKMPGYKAAIDEPSTHHHVRKTYRELKEKIKESLKNES